MGRVGAHAEGADSPLPARRELTVVSQAAGSAPARRGLATGLAVAAVTALVFSRSLGHGFVAWDDEILLVNNPAFRGLGWGHVRWMATNTLLGHYVPVTWLSFAIDHAVWGLHPTGYHLTNVLLHAANAGLVAALAARLLRRATTWPDQVCRLGAVVTALFWALHPLRVEAVSWVTGRRDVLSGFLFLLAVTAYLEAASAEGARRLGWLGATVAAYGLALGSKAIVMTAPLALVALDAYPLRRLPTDVRSWGIAALRGVWLEKVPLVMLAGLAAVGSAVAVPRGAGYRMLGLTPWLGKLGSSLATPLQATVWPVSLSPLYELPGRIDLDAPQYWAAGLLVSGVTLAVLALRWRWPAGVVAWVWYLAFLAPVSAMAHAGPQITADRYSYLPALSVSLLVGGLMAGLVAAAAHADRPGRAPAGVVAGVALVAVAMLAGLAGLSWRQQGVWRDTEALWTHAVQVTPECVRCHVSLGNWLAAHDRAAEAIAHYEQALALDPQRVELETNVGLALVRLGRPGEAVARYERVLARHPDRVGVRVSLTVALLAAGRLPEAVARLEDATRFGSPAELVDYFRRLTTVQPAAPVPWLGLFQAYVRAGDDAHAREAYEALEGLHPALARVSRAKASPGARP
jgi:Tfp pilus assembly protein PilF